MLPVGVFVVVATESALSECSQNYVIFKSCCREGLFASILQTIIIVSVSSKYRIYQIAYRVSMYSNFICLARTVQTIVFGNPMEIQYKLQYY